MYAFKDIKNSCSNNVQWTIEGYMYPIWIRFVDRTSPLPNGLAPWNKNMKCVGIAKKFVSRMESLDSKIEFNYNFKNSQLQNKVVLRHKQEKLSRQHFKKEQFRLKHFHNTLPLKQPYKFR